MSVIFKRWLEILDDQINYISFWGKQELCTLRFESIYWTFVKRFHSKTSKVKLLVAKGKLRITSHSAGSTKYHVNRNFCTLPQYQTIPSNKAWVMLSCEWMRHWVSNGRDSEGQTCKIDYIYSMPQPRQPDRSPSWLRWPSLRYLTLGHIEALFLSLSGAGDD